MHRHILVLGDQLNRRVGPLAAAEPAHTSVLMVESLELAHALPHHKQKLAMCFSAMRHFAAELEEAGFGVYYKRLAASFDAGIEAYLNQFRGVTLTLMEPNDHGWTQDLTEVVERHGGRLEIVTNDLWLTSVATFDAWAEGRATLRLEDFYRQTRAAHGYLMDDAGEPIGGRWNFDAENRETPDPGHTFPTPVSFEPDEITDETLDEVASRFHDHFGRVRPFRWPVTRADAVEALEDFCANRLRHFGAYEDAMVSDRSFLYHSLLSIPLNLGLLHPREVVDTAIAYWQDGRRKIPLNSIEGFVRQVLGWREFMHHVYRRTMPELKDMNELGHQASLPELYWTGETRMNCVSQCVRQVRDTGYAHHIQRLMVLGTFGLIAGIRPRELLDWFTAGFVDALDWVMVPNVIGMSQYADGGGFTSKPYAASANYIHRMSDYCGECSYDHRSRLGEDACPFNSLYWDFIQRHREVLADNPRMNMALATWRKMSDPDQQAVIAQAEDVKRKLETQRL